MSFCACGLKSGGQFGKDVGDAGDAPRRVSLRGGCEGGVNEHGASAYGGHGCEVELPNIAEGDEVSRIRVGEIGVQDAGKALGFAHPGVDGVEGPVEAQCVKGSAESNLWRVSRENGAAGEHV